MKKGYLRSMRALLLSAAIVLTGCSSTSQKMVQEQNETTTITFSWWGNDDRNEYTLRAIQYFEQQNPDIQVKCQYSDWSGYQLRNRIQLASKTECDVMQVNYAWITQYSADGTGYYDLNKVSDLLHLDNFSDSYLDYGRAGDALNALPIALNAQTLYFNKTLFSEYGLEVPRSMDDLFAAAKVMQKDGVYPLGMMQKAFWMFAIANIEQTTGKQFAPTDGKTGFGLNEWKQVFRLYQDMVDQKVLIPLSDFNRTRITERICAGSLAWLSDAENYCNPSIKQGDEMVISDCFVANGAKRYGWYIKPATMYAVSSNTIYPEQAARLLDFLLNDAYAVKQQELEKGIPLSRTAQNVLKENNLLHGIAYDAYQVMERNSDRMELMDPELENEAYIDRFKELSDQVIYHETTLDDAAQSFYTEFFAD